MIWDLLPLAPIISKLEVESVERGGEIRLWILCLKRKRSMADGYYSPDFEFEEPIRISRPPLKKKKNLIGLDDLLEDHEKEQKMLNERKSKQQRMQKVCVAETEFDEATEAQLSECVDKCQQEISQINGEEEMSSWGVQVFGNQAKFPQLEYSELGTSILMRSFVTHEIYKQFKMNIEKGEDFIEAVLRDSWLLHAVNMTGHVEASIALWTFNLMLYSPKIRLMEAACDFWHAILRDKADSSRIKVDWLPRYGDLKRALRAYGFLLDSTVNISSDVDMVSADIVTTGPPQNIRSWIVFANACCQIRNSNLLFTTEEAEELLIVFVSLFLDRQLVGLSISLHEGMCAVINFFTDDKWPDSCNKVAESLSNRLPCNSNCLRAVESIAGADRRSKQLRSSVAHRCLMMYLDVKSSDPENILRSLASINLKDKNCDLFKMYMYLSLAQNWLFLDTPLQDQQTVQELWEACLRNCSCGITITDLRTYASNVRSKASYLLQSSTSK